jgi:hypothetical protein
MIANLVTYTFSTARGRAEARSRLLSPRKLTVTTAARRLRRQLGPSVIVSNVAAVAVPETTAPNQPMEDQPCHSTTAD